MVDDARLVEYLRRSYHAVDGLWFMMVEDATDFDEALELDRRVWAILAKIQARKARQLLECEGNEPDELAQAFSLKLTGDGHEFEVDVDAQEVRFVIRQCPWIDLLSNSDRMHLAQKVSTTICPTEGETWCREFGGEYRYEMPDMMCAGSGRCVMRFVRDLDA